MTETPTYRWEIRRAAKERRENFDESISSHDLVILAVIMAMLVIVIRIILIFGVTQGMEIGPFTPNDYTLNTEPSPYVNFPSVNESFHKLKYISAALFIYWFFASWHNLVSKTVSLSTKFFKGLLGISIIILLASSLFPEHALFLAEIWFDPPYRPQNKV